MKKIRLSRLEHPIRKISTVLCLAGVMVLPLVLFSAGFLPKNLPAAILQPKPVELTTPLTVPIYNGALPIEQTFPNASASAIYIMDRKSGSILYQRNSHELRAPASTAKMMTALLANWYSDKEVIQIKEEAFAT